MLVQYHVHVSYYTVLYVKPKVCGAFTLLYFAVEFIKIREEITRNDHAHLSSQNDLAPYVVSLHQKLLHAHIAQTCADSNVVAESKGACGDVCVSRSSQFLF